jgi:hypothetical protein
MLHYPGMCRIGGTALNDDKRMVASWNREESNRACTIVTRGLFLGGEKVAIR